VSSRSKWQFTDELLDLKAQVTKQEQQEKANGRAVELPGELFTVFKPEVL
jgi:hypothetical protein